MPQTQTRMLLQIAERYNKELDDVFAVGDSLRDLLAAQAAGALPILVLTGKGKKTRAESELPEGTLIVEDLAAAVDFILKS